MKPIFDLTGAGWLRMVIYAVASLVGVAALVATSMGKPEWGEFLGTLASAGVALIGGTAIANLPKAPDQVRAQDAAFEEELEKFRKMLAPYKAQIREPEIATNWPKLDPGPAPHPSHAADELPVFRMPDDRM